MTLPSDWKMGKCLEWYTEVPFRDRPRESPVFLIQNVECSFHLCRMNFSSDGRYFYYYLYVKPKTSDAQLKTFPLTIYSDDSSINSFTRRDAKFSTSDQCLTSFNESVVTGRGASVGCGHFLRLILIFGTEDGPTLPLETKSDEKFTQTNMMFSLQTDEECLSLDFGQLLQTDDHSDVQLQCKGGSIPAHRTILAARSRTFSDMFQDGTSESQSGQVNLTATDISVMKLCLEFIYKGKIEEVPMEMATNLYVLGHALKISSLAKKCADLMISNASEDNYITYLILADKYNDDHFKCGLGDYISDHTDLLKTEKWIKFSNEHTKIGVEVYQKCMFK